MIENDTQSKFLIAAMNNNIITTLQNLAVSRPYLFVVRYQFVHPIILRDGFHGVEYGGSYFTNRKGMHQRTILSTTTLVDASRCFIIQLPI